MIYFIAVLPEIKKAKKILNGLHYLPKYGMYYLKIHAILWT